MFPDEKVILSPGCMHWLRKAGRTTASHGLVAALCAWEKAIHGHVPLCETQVAWEFERGIFTARIHVGSLPNMGQPRLYHAQPGDNIVLTYSHFPFVLAATLQFTVRVSMGSGSMSVCR